MNQNTAVIVGAGPAGLTAASELLDHTRIKPVIFEMSSDIGGISKTVNYKGNRIDIGGHRFFSKSDRVMEWWKKTLPLQGKPARDDLALDRKIIVSKEEGAPDPEEADGVMLARSRLSRIFFLRTFFDYPISLKMKTLSNLGPMRVTRIGLSYIKAQLFPIDNVCSLEDFIINRFGKELYSTFFKDYTEKVWGVPCTEIRPDWGAQRIKGLSVAKTVADAVKKRFRKDESLEQKQVETSLIEQFMYPKFGPGQLWEEVARRVVKKGGEIHLNRRAVGVHLEGDRVKHVTIEEVATGKRMNIACDYLLSTMPVKDLIAAMCPQPPDTVLEVAEGLRYRDFITVGLLMKKLKIRNETGLPTVDDIIPDNWIYIQERDVKLGRLQIFNNWSPYMVGDPGTVWLGLEYFCNEGDDLWSMGDSAFTEFAVDELASIDIIEKSDVLDATVIRMPKTYPAYFGTYDRFDLIREFTDRIGNLFMIGRNGMHRYNNADHSMLTAIEAVQNIANGDTGKENIWAVNVEEEYHEKKTEA